MNYQETLEWMFNQLPMYQQQGAVAYKADLSNTIKLVNHLNNPQDSLKTIHIAGTNGKGSTSSMIASILQEAGYKVGLYTSPHLKDFRERIKINGQEITESFVVDFIARNKPFFEENSLSFFEMTVGMCFEYFKQEAVDVAVIEVGMGGRLDATNIINPLLSVITNIGKDHTAFLGDTLEAIAGEKAGIIKRGVPVVIGEYNESTQPVFIAKAKEMSADIYFAQDTYKENTLVSDLKGDYQKSNIRTVRQAIELLRNSFVISEKAEVEGLLRVVENTKLLGRWQVLGEKPKVVTDTAHNSHGLTIVMNQLKHEKYQNLHIVFGVVNDKDLDSILPLLPKEAKYFFARPNNLRGLDAEILATKASEFGLNGEVFSSIPNAYAKAKEVAGAEDLIYIGGSTFVVAEIL
ncbi:bifunctional folylpolyglutamate synthase/dihydrofolate synthase [Myroides marinus]|uniref:bifunctional folylpolyglutamate synthase/dihydrofolate synthase n=1 Tax=Myroides marinus TaxID=703342 RepID=UPI002578D14B|nr:folylpolyglutamate synthase/dihydrofolate synthase family protein [Myroides marinus]MDM1346823.1 bifunctional folylpolyglutamate synthase/dihydrofolate synthase [Myroides marinus]MDM1352403.1 bifunctional folylpolyglutamate synthase/dihydrofolate synthase [Myroides marinus]MDM1359620.1 bifunctional folylpolyglutamate synthase/dihydrofolate synthase [Myroides marinus]MDM1366731.1 bifunctional folylpolyglutamate synthase/dihydrofolate synthase [Myroides marinus]MDM1368681.1 bifunctional folyl